MPEAGRALRWLGAHHVHDGLRVLTLTPFYPALDNPALGCFVSEPLAAMDAGAVKSEVVAAQSWAEARRKGRRQSSPEFPCQWISYPALPTRWGLPSAGPGLSLAITALESRWSADSPDLIHAHAALPCGHAAVTLARKLGIPFVVTVHGLDAFADHQVPGWAGRLSCGLSRRVYSEAARVVCVSRAVEEQVLAGMDGVAVRTEVIYNGADQLQFFPEDEHTDELVVLTVGNLIPIKGHDRVIRAVAELRKRFPRLRLKVIGDGPERAPLERLAGEVGCPVRFLGTLPRAEVAAHMRACAVFVLPSRYEALGCVYLEAMACAKPVIACSGQGVGEIVQDGVSGMLVPVEDPGDAALTAALAELLAQPDRRRELGQAGCAKVMSSFLVQHQAQHLIALYATVREDGAQARRGGEKGT